MAENLDPVTRLFRSCEPGLALQPDDLRYVNCDDVRGENVVRLIERSLRRADPSRPEVKLFAGTGELPVYERLGDVRARAVTMGRIADALQTRGELDEALRILREEELPVYERLGDVRAHAIATAQTARLLMSRGRANDREEAGRLLRLALSDAEKLRIPEAKQIRAVLEHITDRP